MPRAGSSGRMSVSAFGGWIYSPRWTLRGREGCVLFCVDGL